MYIYVFYLLGNACPRPTTTAKMMTTPPIIMTTTDSMETTTKVVPPAPPGEEYRLPLHFIPFHYNLRIRTAFAVPQPFPFSGTVKMFLTCVNASNSLTVHSHALNLTSDPLFHSMDASGTSPKYSSYEFDVAHDFLIIHFDGPTTKGANYTLELSYSGFLNNDLVGFYNGSYPDGNKTR